MLSIDQSYLEEEPILKEVPASLGSAARVEGSEGGGKRFASDDTLR